MALGLQYFSIFDNPLELELHEVARVPELLRALAGTQGEFWQAVTDWLTGTLASRKLQSHAAFPDCQRVGDSGQNCGYV